MLRMNWFGKMPHCIACATWKVSICDLHDNILPARLDFLQMKVVTTCGNRVR